ncbi:hypothetical protein F3Y22_tig00110812pilonHSYRG00124 [Hibiscus syriacus]|uniref:Uncharacterized protein n=1 Tax=Hibiscus syriacus TaxID=106335 RepID=A0A6A2ZNV6_HIBSY|nr:uncharacterized protein LOC120141567 [Hibiscus syriacus]KAE8693463.1 hypothetical protein F3Y22_tig00110812pilonHSYRG00124 [Hibiscus syriacus]
MVKPVRQKNKAVLTFRVNPPINPGTKKISHSRVSLVPKEVRKLANNGILGGLEPVSPRVSCTGHIQIESQMKKKRGVGKHKQAFSPLAQALVEQIKRKVLNGRKRGYESDVFDASSETEDAGPSLQQMRQFRYGSRSTLSDFNWRAYDAEKKGKTLNGRKRGYEFDFSDVHAPSEATQAAPSLQQMRQFSKGRSTLSDFYSRSHGAEEKRKVLNRRNNGYESDDSDSQVTFEAADVVAPSLQQMRQFCSRRSTLSEFDDAEEAADIVPPLQQMRQFYSRRSTLSGFDSRAYGEVEKGKKMLNGRKRGYESDEHVTLEATEVGGPSLGRMKQFCSRRKTSPDFDSGACEPKEKRVKRKRR